MGGSGWGKGKTGFSPYQGGKGQGVYAPRYGGHGNGHSQGSGSGFTGMVGQLHGFIENLSALGELQRLGALFNSQPGSSSAVPGNQNEDVQAKAMADAITRVFESKTTPEQPDTRLQETANRLQGMVGGTPSGISDQALEASPVIQQLRTSVSSLLGTVQTQGRQIGALQTTVDTTSENVLATRQLLEGFLASGGARRQAPPGGAGGLGAPGLPGMAGAAGVAAAPGAAAAGAPDPLFGQFVDAELHARALQVLGVGVGRGDMQQLAAAIATAGSAQITFQEWWTSVQKTKTMIQWKAKATALGCPDPGVNGLTSFRLVGQALFSLLVSDGTWHSSSMQQIILQ